MKIWLSKYKLSKDNQPKCEIVRNSVNFQVLRMIFLDWSGSLAHASLSLVYFFGEYSAELFVISLKGFFFFHDQYSKSKIPNRMQNQANKSGRLQIKFHKRRHWEEKAP